VTATQSYTQIVEVWQWQLLQYCADTAAAAAAAAYGALARILSRTLHRCTPNITCSKSAPSPDNSLISYAITANKKPFNT